MTSDRPNSEGVDHEDSDDTGEVEIEISQGHPEPRTDSRRRHHKEPDRRRESVDREGTLADELGRIDVMTTPDGDIEGQITGLEAVDETTVQLSVALPHGETATFRLEKPIPWSSEFLLARIVEDVGYDAASIDHIVGDTVYIRRTDREPAETEWLSSSLERASDTLLTSLSGGRYRLVKDDSPEWRLVDPLERPDPSAEDSRLRRPLGATLVLAGPLVAAVSAVITATGQLTLSGGVIGAILMGLILAVIGMGLVLEEPDTR